MLRDRIFTATLSGIVLLGFADAAQALCTLPYQIVNGQIADAAPVMADFNRIVSCLNNAGGATNSIQYNAGSGTLGGVGPLTNGQLVIGSTGNAPQAATLTAGNGISISTNPGQVTIAATGGGGGSWPPLQPPLTSMFTSDKGVTGVTTTQSDDVNIGYLNYVDFSTLTSGDRYAAKVTTITNSGDWQATWRMVFSGVDFNYWTAGLILYQEGRQSVAFVGYNYSNTPRYQVTRYNQATGSYVDAFFSGNTYNSGQGYFLKVAYTQSSDVLAFYFSKNGKIWEKMGSMTATSLLGGPADRIGFGNAPNASGGDYGNVGFNVDYWVSNAF